jgi:dinuclear metal center protein, YbgI family
MLFGLIDNPVFMEGAVSFADIESVVGEWAPWALQESYDNSGLLLGERDTKVTGILVSFDIREAVVEEAVERGCNLVVSHHPLVFKGLKNLRGDDPVSRTVMLALRNRVGVLAAHTNADSTNGGVSYLLGARLGLKSMRALVPKDGQILKLATYVPPEAVEGVLAALHAAGAGCIGAYSHCSFSTQGEGRFYAPPESAPYAGAKGQLNRVGEVRIETVCPSYRLASVLEALVEAHPYEEPAYDVYQLINRDSRVGLGCIGMLDEALDEKGFLARVAESLGTPWLRYSNPTGRLVRRVAVCGGSGADMIGQAMAQGADAYVTADVKYHDFQQPVGRMLLVDAGHRESELMVVGALRKLIQERFTTFAVWESSQDASPVHYYRR